MKHHVRSVISALVTGAGFAARELTASTWRFAIYGVALAAVYLVGVWDLKPDKRIDKIRRAELDAKFKTLFAAARAALKGDERPPLRVNAITPGRTWYFWPVLRLVYSYEMRRTDPDHGMSWKRPRGCAGTF